ncbi:MAG TPA: hypothetical protein VMR45_02775 [Patescibacteria group bacterium]|nr:hypothetical protein [Patescibacteria group bacterium]
MDPTEPQNIPPSYTPPNNPYQFIMEPPKKVKRRGLPGGISNNPLLMKLILILGGAIIVLIIAAIIVNVFFSAKTNISDLVTVVQTENEIARVASQGTRGTDPQVQNSGITTQLTLITQQQSWLNFLTNHGRKVAPKEQALKKNTDTDAQLTQAQETSTFDSTFAQILRTQLDAYSSELQDAYQNATNNQEKILLNAHYKQAQMLIQQLPQLPQ